MANIPVILIGPENKEQREDALYKLWDLKNMWTHTDKDPRLEFSPEISKENMESEFNAYSKHCVEEEKEREPKTVNEYAYMFYGFEFSEKDQAYGYFRNPNGKFVDYEIGGHFDSLIPLNNDAKDQYGMYFANYAKIKDIDFEKAKELAKDALEEAWEHAWEVFPDVDNSEEESNRKEIFGIEMDDTLEEWQERFQNEYSFTPLVIIQNKEWKEKEMQGFFGVDPNRVPDLKWSKDFADLIKSLDPETMITMIDCSIAV